MGEAFDNALETINFKDIYTIRGRKMLKDIRFLTYIETWRMLELGAPLEKTPYYEWLMSMPSPERPKWKRFTSETAKQHIKHYLTLYENFKEDGYAPEKFGVYPEVRPWKDGYWLHDGLNRLSLLYALGREEAKFIVWLPENAKFEENRLKTMVERAHSYYFNYNQQKINRKMPLYLPINHPLYQKQPYIRSDARTRLDIIQEEKLKGKRILDIGCNTGFYCIELAKKRAKCTGIDIKKEFIETSKLMSYYNKPRDARWMWCRFLHIPLEKFLEESGEKFDYILFLSVFHHMLKRNIEEAWYILKELSERAPVMFFETAFSDEEQMKRPPSHSLSKLRITEETVPKLVLDHSDYTSSKTFKNPQLPKRPLYKFWRE